jgi:hypothetical protein
VLGIILEKSWLILDKLCRSVELNLAWYSLCWAFSRSRVSDQYGMPTNDDRVLAIGDGKVLVRLSLVMYVSSSGFVSKGTRFL